MVDGPEYSHADMRTLREIVARVFKNNHLQAQFLLWFIDLFETFNKRVGKNERNSQSQDVQQIEQTLRPEQGTAEQQIAELARFIASEYEKALASPWLEKILSPFELLSFDQPKTQGELERRHNAMGGALVLQALPEFPLDSVAKPSAQSLQEIVRAHYPDQVATIENFLLKALQTKSENMLADWQNPRTDFTPREFVLITEDYALAQVIATEALRGVLAKIKNETEGSAANASTYDLAGGKAIFVSLGDSLGADISGKVSALMKSLSDAWSDFKHEGVAPTTHGVNFAPVLVAIETTSGSGIYPQRALDMQDNVLENTGVFAQSLVWNILEHTKTKPQFALRPIVITIASPDRHEFPKSELVDDTVSVPKIPGQVLESWLLPDALKQTGAHDLLMLLSGGERADYALLVARIVMLADPDNNEERKKLYLSDAFLNELGVGGIEKLQPRLLIDLLWQLMLKDEGSGNTIRKIGPSERLVFLGQLLEIEKFLEDDGSFIEGSRKKMIAALYRLVTGGRDVDVEEMSINVNNLLKNMSETLGIHFNLNFFSDNTPQVLNPSVRRILRILLQKNICIPTSNFVFDEDPNSYFVCASCGQPISSNSKPCTSCGAPLEIIKKRPRVESR